MLLGNLGADPELRHTGGGQAVLNLRLATTESYLDKDKVRQTRTDWHNVVVWGNRGEALARILQKGSSIFVEGSIRTSSYDDREGNKRYKTEIIASNVLLTGGRPGEHEHEGAEPHAGDGRSEGHGQGGGGYRRAEPPPDRGRASAGGAGDGRGAGSAGEGAPRAQGGAQGGAPRGRADAPRAGASAPRAGGGDGRGAPAAAGRGAPPPADDYAGDYEGGGTDDDIPF
jgi:single-strand DNA-binding protein